MLEAPSQIDFTFFNYLFVLNGLKEKEQEYENELPKEEQVIAGEQNTETGLATIRTIETLKSAEKVIEALNIHLEEKHKFNMYTQALANVATKEEKEKVSFLCLLTVL